MNPESQKLIELKLDTMRLRIATVVMRLVEIDCCEKRLRHTHDQLGQNLDEADQVFAEGTIGSALLECQSVQADFEQMQAKILELIQE